MADTPDTAGRMKPWMRGLLIVSLALNILVLGLAGGWVLRHGGVHGGHPSRLDMAGGPLTRALSDEDRREIGRRMRQAYREGQGAHGGMRASFDALVADLRAVPFEPERVAARMREQREGFAARFEMGQQVLLEHLAQMSDAERAAYADRVQARIDEYRARRAHKAQD
ncbi:Heavy-metal resistance [Roseovarius azorensis]|uniref:Heavy-metal resistance n=1 Tax=Roseovarius azorensis TaxID=1287727 RepID=A0A1H7MHH4_9RHOB|nr:periplasmic heavy metal sensor [Roseovarius azorensis]SEL10077.1 Heavy-metal resistance [Roseovarius azorensis]